MGLAPVVFLSANPPAGRWHRTGSGWSCICKDGAQWAHSPAVFQDGSQRHRPLWGTPLPPRWVVIRSALSGPVRQYGSLGPGIDAVQQNLASSTPLADCMCELTMRFLEGRGA
jgi:hypothetical protein